MSLAEKLSGVFNKRPSDAVGIDIGSSGTKVVRVKRSGENYTLVKYGLFPPLGLSEITNLDAEIDQSPFDLPAAFKGKHLGLGFTSNNTTVKLLNFPGGFNDAAVEKIGQHLGLDEETEEKYRLSYKLLSEAKGESKVLGVAFPHNIASTITDMFPAGLPAPYSIEASGLASLSSFLKGPGAQAEGLIGAIDFGETQTYYALFNKQELSLIRRFDFGLSSILAKVNRSLGVDMETAKGIIEDGSFDISQPVSEVMAPLIKQLIISRDFIERRENSTVSTMYLCGAYIPTSSWITQLKSTMAVEFDTWDPFAGMTVADDALEGAAADAHKSRFAGAAGIALSILDPE